MTSNAARKDVQGVEPQVAANDNHDEWMVTVEAAKHCHMSKRALLKHVAMGRLVPDSRARPGFKVHRFLRSSLDRFLKGNNGE